MSSIWVLAVAVLASETRPSIRGPTSPASRPITMITTRISMSVKPNLGPAEHRDMVHLKSVEIDAIDCLEHCQSDEADQGSEKQDHRGFDERDRGTQCASHFAIVRVCHPQT